MTPEQLKTLVKSPMFRDAMGDEADNVEKMCEDPETMKQMTGFWKQLDDMHHTDKKGYDEFIKNQREDFEKGQAKERERREKERIINGTSLCSFRILVARIINKEKSVTDSIKLFDFNANAEMNDK